MQARRQVGRDDDAVYAAAAKALELVHDGARVAVIPPVSGGSGEDVDYDEGLYRVTTKVMDGDAQRLVDLVQRDEAGALNLFYGRVRNHHEGRAVERLEYEAHSTMALRQLQRTAVDAGRDLPAQLAEALPHLVVQVKRVRDQEPQPQAGRGQRPGHQTPPPLRGLPNVVGLVVVGLVFVVIDSGHGMGQ